MITAGVAFEPDVTAGNIPAGKGKVSGGSRETHNRPSTVTQALELGTPPESPTVALFVRKRQA